VEGSGWPIRRSIWYCCNPTHLHPERIKALEAGSMCWLKGHRAGTGDADAMVAAAAKAGGCSCRHVFRSFRSSPMRPGHTRRPVRQLSAAIQTGDTRSPIGRARSRFEQDGGAGIDLHITNPTSSALVCVCPDRCSHRRDGGERGELLTTQYLYGKGGPAITCSSVRAGPERQALVHGLAVFETATLVYESGRAADLLTADGKVEQSRLAAATMRRPRFTLEIQAAVDGVSEGQEPDLRERKIGARCSRPVPSGVRVGANGQDDRGEVRVSSFFVSCSAWRSASANESYLRGLEFRRRTSWDLRRARCWDNHALGGRLVQLLMANLQFTLAARPAGCPGGLGHLADLQLMAFLAAFCAAALLGFSRLFLALRGMRIVFPWLNKHSICLGAQKISLRRPRQAGKGQ